MVHPTLFTAEHMHAQPIRTTADSPTVNVCRGMINAHKSIRGSWCRMAIPTIFAAGYGTVDTNEFKSLKIRG